MDEYFCIHHPAIMRSFLSTLKEMLLIIRSALWHLHLIQRLSPSYVSSFHVAPKEYSGIKLARPQCREIAASLF